MSIIQKSDSILIADASYLMHFFVFSAYKEYLTHFSKPALVNKYDFSCDDEYVKIFNTKVFSYFNFLRTKYMVQDNIVICCDCKRSDIWRKSIYPNYKINRETKDETKENFSTIYKYYHDYILAELKDKKGYKLVRVHNAEADDIIAVVKFHERSLKSDKKIVIIANDKDFLQLYDSNTVIVDVSGKDLSRHSVGTIKDDLIFKILIGDIGDVIHGVKEGLGKAKALKLIKDKTKLKQLLAEDKEVEKNFKFNMKLVDLTKIPQEVVDGILEEYKKE